VQAKMIFHKTLFILAGLFITGFATVTIYSGHIEVGGKGHTSTIFLAQQPVQFWFFDILCFLLGAIFIVYGAFKNGKK
jgi:hypothetical protein